MEINVKKTIEKLIQKAEKYSLDKQQIEVLKNTKYTCKQAQIIFDYFIMCLFRGDTTEKSIDEVNYVFQIYKKENEVNQKILNVLLPSDWEINNTMGYELSRKQKKIIANMTLLQNGKITEFDMLVKLLAIQIPNKNLLSLFRYYINNKIYFYFSKKYQQKIISDIRKPNSIIVAICDLGLDLPNDDYLVQILDNAWNIKEIQSLYNGMAFEDKIFFEKSNPFIKYINENYDIKANEVVLSKSSQEDNLKYMHQIAPENEITINAIHCVLTIRLHKNAININCNNYSKSFINKNGNIYPTHIKSNIKIVIFGKRKYYENYKNKWIPLRISTLKQLYDSCADASNLIEYIFHKEAEDNLFANDIYKLIQRKSSTILPWSLNDMLQYSSPKDFIFNNYKQSRKLKININKYPMELTYLFIKSWNKIDDLSKGILLEHGLKDDILNKITMIHWKNSIEQYIKECYLLHQESVGKKLDDSTIKTFKDYIHMCIIANEKICLRRVSQKKIAELHNRVSERNYMKHTPPVKVPKESKFKKLRKLLPKEFEWIKSRPRLIQETVMQNHCVWSYAEKINKDTCAIYSFIYKPENTRYTIEFTFKNDKYKIIQIKSKSNHNVTIEAKEYIMKFLNKI